VSGKLRQYFIASPCLAGKTGRFGSGGSVASKTASSVSQTHAYTEAIWLQTTFFAPLDHSPPYQNPSTPPFDRRSIWSVNFKPVIASLPVRHPPVRAAALCGAFRRLGIPTYPDRILISPNFLIVQPRLFNPDCSTLLVQPCLFNPVPVKCREHTSENTADENFLTAVPFLHHVFQWRPRFEISDEWRSEGRLRSIHAAGTAAKRRRAGFFGRVRPQIIEQIIEQAYLSVARSESS
jgi:hypothetical protein